MIYLDASALIKLVVAQPESAAMTDYLRAHPDDGWFTCALTRIDLLRAAAAVHTDAIEHAHHILDVLDTVAITDRLIHAATSLDPPPPRTADALHIAAALTAGPRLQTLITYDTQLVHAATAHTIATATPGAPACCAP